MNSKHYFIDAHLACRTRETLIDLTIRTKFNYKVEQAHFIEDDDERDNAQSEFVNENSAELKEGCPTEELLKAMREGLY